MTDKNCTNHVATGWLKDSSSLCLIAFLVVLALFVSCVCFAAWATHLASQFSLLPFTPYASDLADMILIHLDSLRSLRQLMQKVPLAKVRFEHTSDCVMQLGTVAHGVEVCVAHVACMNLCVFFQGKFDMQVCTVDGFCCPNPIGQCMSVVFDTICMHLVCMCVCVCVCVCVCL